MQFSKMIPAGAVNGLLEKDVPVRAIVHRSDTGNESLGKRGFEVVVADMLGPDQLSDALKGAQRAYYLPFFHHYMIQSAVAFAIAAKQAKLESIMHMGQWLSHRAHLAIMNGQTWVLVPPKPTLSVDDEAWRYEHHDLITRQPRPTLGLVAAGE